ncbi:MAG: DUF1697 domain-containing protein [Solirubrobacterales bacterium]
MARFAAFLRAINVGNRKATGEQLRSAAERRGFAEVASFRNSGNLVVSAVDLEIAEVAERLERGLREELGFEVDDRLALRGSELYWLPSAGTQDSDLDQAALGEILGQTTTRTKGTIDAIAAKHFDD